MLIKSFFKRKQTNETTIKSCQKRQGSTLCNDKWVISPGEEHH
jgi:hypothetical protein